MAKRHLLILPLIALVAFSGMNCSNRKLRKGLPAEERLALAKKMFEKGRYLDAKTEFQVLVVSGAGTAIADEAQFYLAECYYHLKDYVTAVAEYERLIRMFPNSPWVDDAQYKIGMSYFKLSPNPGLDQEFTKKALQAFQVFLEDYPDSELRPEVEERMRQCREKLAEKEFRAGVLYRKMGYHKSALIYFDSVLEEYYDTSWAEKALYWKAKELEKLGEPDKALETYQVFVRRYPQSRRLEEVREAIHRLRQELQQQEQRQREPSSGLASPEGRS